MGSVGIIYTIAVIIVTVVVAVIVVAVGVFICLYVKKRMQKTKESDDEAYLINSNHFSNFGKPGNIASTTELAGKNSRFNKTYCTKFLDQKPSGEPVNE